VQGPPGPPADATLFIQNQTAATQAASFKIDGTGDIGGLLSQNNARTEEADTSSVRDAFRISTLPYGGDVFKVRSDGGFVARGFVRDVGNTTGCAALIPATGPGTRFMWHPCRGSIRFGRVPTGQTNWDDANMDDFTFAGGNQVTASGYGAFSYGDQVTVSSTVGVGFGSGVTVSGTAGFSAGASNVCSGFACTAIGYTVRAGGQGAVALGYRTTANNDYTMALGYRASNNTHTGTFVWGDESTTDSVRNQFDNEFRIRAGGGVRLRTSSAANAAPGVNGNTGCDLPAGSGTWSCSSSRYIKENFEELNGEDVLARLSKMPVTRWNFIKDETKAQHIGPVAQDFYSAFHLGESETQVGVQDLAGVALAASQALEKRTRELDERTREIENLRKEVKDMRKEMDDLQRVLKKQAAR
jgi:hypothetical protein